MIPEREPRINDRIDVAGSRGTIRYIGHVDNTQGQWLGIEWDEPTRGKHNGTHSGISYFTTKHPTSGSLIRPHKANLGISIVEAIQKRYGLINDEHAGVDIQTIAQVQKEIKAKLFEFVGAEKINRKQSQYEKLTFVSLREQPIYGLGPYSQALKTLCPNIQELDLSKTLLNSWYSVAEIAQQLVRLRVLDLSENCLEIEDNCYKYAFEQLEHLIFGRAYLSWDDTLICCKSLPNLNILQVPFNCIEVLTKADDCLSKLVELDLEGNKIGSWRYINLLGTLANLTLLNVSNCNIASIYLPDDEPLFLTLQHLILNDNQINNWVSISELDKLPRLRDLKCLKNPILDEENFETNQQIFIARIKNLEVLNGTIILPEERKGAEIDFLKRHGQDYLNINNNESKRIAFEHSYPCYQRLVRKHGAPEESELKKKSNLIHSHLIQVQIFSERDPRTFTKKLPTNMSLQKFGGLIQRLYNVGSTKPDLFCINDKIEIPLDNDMKDLNFYSIQNGDQICVRW